MTDLDAAKNYLKHPLQVAAETINNGFLNTGQGMLRFLDVNEKFIPQHPPTGQNNAQPTSKPATETDRGRNVQNGEHHNT
jgi:hypothetical protein